MHDAPKMMIPETPDRGRINNQKLAARRTTLLHQKDELEGILLSLQERARSGKTKSHIATQRVAEEVVKMKAEVLREIRKW